MTMTVDLRYPVGTFTPQMPATPDVRQASIDAIAALPRQMREAVRGLTDAQLDTPYRPDGWTVRQVVHHVADSHMNGFIRLKLALTEDTPTIKPYEEKRWAELPDMRLPVDVSLLILDNVHVRWGAVYHAMTPAQFTRTFFHPELNDTLTLDTHLQLYAWHSRHHVGHITALRTREGW
jgi:DinB superfamily